MNEIIKLQTDMYVKMNGIEEPYHFQNSISKNKFNYGKISEQYKNKSINMAHSRKINVTSHHIVI